MADQLYIRTGVDGIVGTRALFEDVLTRLEIVLRRWGARHGAEKVSFPPVISQAHLEQNGYLKNFPQLATALHGVRSNDTDTARTTVPDNSPIGLMMVPSACYPIYSMVSERGKLQDSGNLFNIQSWCFRREATTNDARLQSFRMQEYVKLGTAEDVLAFREAWMQEAQQLFTSLKLPHQLSGASDAFFGRLGRLMVDSQRERNLKVELLVPILSGADPTACASFNYAEDYFTKAWQIAMQSGVPAHSGCVGFGMERTTLALFTHHGPDPDRWPAEVQRVLFE